MADDFRPLVDAEVDAFLAECEPADPERVARIRKRFEELRLDVRMLADSVFRVTVAVCELPDDWAGTVNEAVDLIQARLNQDDLRLHGAFPAMMTDDDRKNLQSLAELLAAQAEATRAALGGVRDELNVLSAAVRALARRLGALERGRLTDARGHTHKGQG